MIPAIAACRTRPAPAKDSRLTEPDKIRNGDSPASPAPVIGEPDREDTTAPEPLAGSSNDGTPTATDDPDTTVGTGSAIALGCVAATILLILIGLIFLAIVAILN